jgi:hypothetical protein
MQGRWAFGLTVTATLWGLALVAGALVVPVYSGGTLDSSGAFHATSATLVAENGAAALAVAALPAVLALLVWLALHRKCSRGSAWAGPVAWTLVGVLGVFCLLGILTVGVFVMPIALALAGAAALTPG